MKRLIIYIIFILLSFNFFSIEIKKAKNPANDNNAAVQKTGRFFLVLVALDNYKNRLPLQGHVNDAIQLKWNLYSRYEIDEVIELYDIDASRSNILKLVSELQMNLKQEDTLLFYFSGHGYNDLSNKDSYWIPYEGGINENLKQDWISTSSIAEKLYSVKSNQVFMIIDSCFNKDNKYFSFFNKIDDKQTSLDKSNQNKKVRHILTSGVDETSNEKSEFSDQIINYVKKMDNTYFNSFMIFNDLKEKLKRNIPLFGYLKTSTLDKIDEKATFTFYPRKEKIAIKELEDSKKNKEDKTIKIDTKKTTDYDKLNDLIKSSQSRSNLNIVNKIGIAALPTFVTVTVAGYSILLTDLLGVMKTLNNDMNNGTDYEVYVRTYKIHMALFISGVALAATGSIGIGCSIPLLMYKDKKTSLSFNITAGVDYFDLNFKYNF